MPRLFAALALPDLVRRSLIALRTGIPGARWIEEGSLHLTLRFIGEVDGAQALDIDAALAQVDGRGFAVTLAGVGQFGDKSPHTLWAGVEANEALVRLTAKIEQTLQRTGLPAEPRRFTPHVTLARLRDAPRARVAEFLSMHGLFRTGPFPVDEFILFSSHLGTAGAHYRAEAFYPLASA